MKRPGKKKVFRPDAACRGTIGQGEARFSLTEILVVIVIVMILLSLMLGIGANFRRRAEISRTKATIRKAEVLLESVFDGRWPGWILTHPDPDLTLTSAVRGTEFRYPPNSGDISLRLRLHNESLDGQDPPYEELDPGVSGSWSGYGVDDTLRFRGTLRLTVFIQDREFAELLPACSSVRLRVDGGSDIFSVDSTTPVGDGLRLRVSKTYSRTWDYEHPETEPVYEVGDTWRVQEDYRITNDEELVLALYPDSGGNQHPINEKGLQQRNFVELEFSHIGAILVGELGSYETEFDTREVRYGRDLAGGDVVDCNYVAIDAWGRALRVRRNLNNAPGLDIWSAGPSGSFDNEDDNITNWERRGQW